MPLLLWVLIFFSKKPHNHTSFIEKVLLDVFFSLSSSHTLVVLRLNAFVLLRGRPPRKELQREGSCTPWTTILLTFPLSLLFLKKIILTITHPYRKGAAACFLLVVLLHTLVVLRLDAFVLLRGRSPRKELQREGSCTPWTTVLLAFPAASLLSWSLKLFFKENNHNHTSLSKRCCCMVSSRRPPRIRLSFCI